LEDFMKKGFVALMLAGALIALAPSGAKA